MVFRWFGIVSQPIRILGRYKDGAAHELDKKGYFSKTGYGVVLLDEIFALNFVNRLKISFSICEWWKVDIPSLDVTVFCRFLKNADFPAFCQ